MKDAYDLLGEIFSLFKLPLTWWTVTLFIVLFFTRDRLAKAINLFLDFLGRNVATGVGSRRYLPRYKELVREGHLHLKIVGLRTEEERRPKITDAYVPISLLLQGDSIDHALSVNRVIRDHRYTLILG